jgi:hypothetical protein
MAPTSDAADFCAKCGAPLTPHASTDPVASIRSEMELYVQASEKPRNAIVLIGMWLLWGPVAIGGVLVLLYFPYLIFFTDTPSGIHSFGDAVGAIFALLLILFILGGLFVVAVRLLYPTTRNYFKQRR